MTKDTVVRTIDVFQTKDFEKFTLIKGNRDVDTGHVRSLQKSMLDNGNRTDQEPIEVNSEFEVLDGQHRLAACEGLGFPVCYIVKEDHTVKDIRIRNSNRRNWNWYDFACSYRDELKNKNYEEFLNLHEQYREPFYVLLTYTGQKDVKSKEMLKVFLAGDFVMNDYAAASKLLGMYQEISEVGKHHNKNFAFACYDLMKLSTYNHERMLSKLQAHKSALNSCYLKSDYLFTLQDIWRA